MGELSDRVVTPPPFPEPSVTPNSVDGGGGYYQLAEYLNYLKGWLAAGRTFSSLQSSMRHYLLLYYPAYLMDAQKAYLGGQTVEHWQRLYGDPTQEIGPWRELIKRVRWWLEVQS